MSGNRLFQICSKRNRPWLRKVCMSIFSLKIFALICMILDHIAAYLPDMPVQLRWIGRIAAPIFIFCLCEGVDHTSNEKKYLLRLYIGGVIMAFIQSFIMISANIFRTLLAIAFNLVMIKHIRNGEKEYRKYYLFYVLWQLLTVTVFGYLYMRNQSIYIRRLYPALLGSVAFCEGGLPYIIFGIMVYLLKNNKKKLVLGISLYCAFFALFTLTNITTALTNPIIAMANDPKRMNRIIQYGFFTIANMFRPGITGRNPFMESYQWMMIATAIPIVMYNGQRGRSVKWFFYIFYVTHLIVLWYLGNHWPV